MMAETDVIAALVVVDAPWFGMEFPPVTFPPITRLQLALYCGGSGDHNPIHVDLDFAKAAGLPDVFAHGMLPMGLMGRALGLIAAPFSVKKFSARFVEVTKVDDAITVTSRVSALDTEKQTISVDMRCQNQYGVVTLHGHAVLAMSAVTRR